MIRDEGESEKRKRGRNKEKEKKQRKIEDGKKVEKKVVKEEEK